MAFSLRGFFRKNQEFCLRIEKKLPGPFRRHLFTSYKYLVAEKIDAADKSLVVLDIGGGKACPYLPFAKTAEKHRIIAVDIDENEIRHNLDCAWKVVADAAGASLPFGPRSVDIITSRSTIEHLRDNGSFIRNCHDVLRGDGYLISTFPCRHTPFALINKALPHRVARLLLYYFHPEWRDVCGFKVFYDHCTYPEMRDLLHASGFEILYIELRYYQAIYYDFFVPLYLLMLAYDLLVWRLGAKALCCQMLFIARKRKD